MISEVTFDLEQEIFSLGRKVFAAIGSQSTSAFDKRYWENFLMSWSMGRPELKASLFRLVDVMPVIKSHDQLTKHLRAYLTKPVSDLHPALGWSLSFTKNRLISRIASQIADKAVKQMAQKFIAGSTADSALDKLKDLRKNGFAFTVDLLGEFCVSEDEALAFMDRYLDALRVFGPGLQDQSPLIPGHPGESSPVCISIKLTALYSQTSALNFEKSVAVLSERLSTIVRAAKQVNGLIYVDAEDSGSNPIIFETWKKVFLSPEFIDFPLPGIVVQAYSKKSKEVIDDLLSVAAQRGSKIAIRLVKGAYWDAEKIITQQNDWEFPLWSKKVSSDAHYEYLSRHLLNNHALCVPAFGSHNIRSLSHACKYAESIGLTKKDFEIQVLYGMADPIAKAYSDLGYLARMYVPLGQLIPGMGYLVRRLLENTSNESFLKHTFFDKNKVDHLLAKPEYDLIDRSENHVQL